MFRGGVNFLVGCAAAIDTAITITKSVLPILLVIWKRVIKPSHRTSMKLDGSLTEKRRRSRISEKLVQSKMLVCEPRRHAAARCAVEETDLQKIRFDYLLDRIF